MGAEERIGTVLNILSEVVICHICETRIRFGDYECPHCGADLDEVLQGWARRLLDRLGS